jgi:hypothetical protein
MRASVVVPLVLLSPLVIGPAEAQVVDDCESGQAERDLDINSVRARVFNGGNLFFGNTTVAGDGYLVPKHTGHSPIFAGDLWVGGRVDGEHRAAGSRYFNFQFAPGPLDADGNPPEDCSQYDRIYRVSRGDVQRYYETGEATDDLRDWPVDLGAAVLDGDGVSGNYNLEGGDEPAISGEQMLWWVMNDVGTAELLNRTPVPVEVRASTFAIPSTVPALDQATLYRFEVTYRGTQPLDSAYVAFWKDIDLGDASDDYIGTDTTLDMSFAYNGDEVDARYGVPPAVGTKLLRGPVGLPNGRDDDGDGAVDEAGERLGVTASSCYFDAPVFTSPTERIYNCLRGRWFNGEPMITSGLGFPFGDDLEGDTTTIAFPGDPVTSQFWSEENANYEGESNSPGDRWYSLSSGPFRMEPGETVEIVFAIPFAQGADRLDSVVKLREAAGYLQRAYDLGLFEPQRVRPAPTEPPPPTTFALRAFPNPFAASASVELTVADGAGALRLAVYDVLGREVAVLADGVLAPGVHPFALDGAELPTGVYFVRLETGRQTESLTLVHVE